MAFYLVIIAVILWYVLEHTPFGRYLLATGGNSEAARLVAFPWSSQSVDR